MWELPVGQGRKFGSDMGAIADGFLGGWRLVGINTMASGVPVNLSYTPTAQFSVGGQFTYRPNLTGDPETEDGGITNYLNSANVAIPTDRSQPFGNAPRNVARGPSFWQVDLGLHKAFGLGRDNTRLEARIEAFNLLNKTNFNTPERQPFGDRVRHDHEHAAGTADSAGREAVFLGWVFSNRRSRRTTKHRRSSQKLLRSSKLRRSKETLLRSFAFLRYFDLSDSA